MTQIAYHLCGFASRYETYDDPQEQQRRETRGKEFFDVLWTPEAAEGIRKTMKKHHPDLCTFRQFSQDLSTELI